MNPYSNSVPVLYAQLQDALFVPGVGNLPRTIDPKHTGPIEMSFSAEEQGVNVSWRGSRFLIPLNNFQVIIFEKADAKKA